VGLQTYSGEVRRVGGEGAAESSFEGYIQSVSPDGHRLSGFLYVCLVVTLLLSVWLLWYIALFYRYLKQFAPFTPIPSRDHAVRGFGGFILVLA
jgi:hypothetical protein